MMDWFDVLINVLETALITCFLFMQREKNDRRTYVSTAVYFLCAYAFITIANLYSVAEGYYVLIDILIAALYLRMISEGPWTRILTIAVIPDLALTVMNHMYTILLLELFSADSYQSYMVRYRIPAVLFIQAVHAVVFYMIHRYLRSLDKDMNHRDTLISMLVIYLAVLIVQSFAPLLYESNIVMPEVRVGVVMTFMMTVAIGFLLHRINQENRELIRSREELDRLKYERHITGEIIASQKQLRSLKHDINHLMTAIERSELTTDEDIMHSSGIIKNKIKMISHPVITSVPILDFVLNIKRDEAAEKGIDVHCMINLHDQIDISDDELYLLVSNILDNAIRHIGIGKKIEINIRQDGMICIMSFSNSADRIVKEEEMHPNDHDLKGYGFETIRRIIENNNGTVIFEQDPEFFHVHLCLRMKKADEEQAH